ncbi:oligopeptide ABC transporter substrate-binding protein [Mesobacillus foraminis]|uniref:Peptide/nickel transport system substrate-binding protein n=1 Tax=Mesobacillus foraminis TaxID=279826 RepID=A0A4R2BMD3_9BACI|nr:oligopeptide ABC transporter substrate-binding protein [Mesobacillus foraminis]TCN27875.1 peptide/nickel transport system substrate-binding protein [Mesobacillus foraminis]
MKKPLLWFAVLVMSMSAFLAACSGGEKSNTDDKKDNAANDSKPQDGGTMTYALDTEFKGLLNWNFYDTDGDDDIIQLFDDPLIDYDENLKAVPNIASWETEDNQNYTFTFKKGVKWHNGEELTVHDWVFALETIASIGGEHQRWSNVNTIEGAKEFNEGKADAISGLEAVDDYTIKIKFDKARVNNLENVWAYPLSRKEFESVAPKDMAASEQVRSKPVGTGPFKVSKVIPGESVELVRNEEYWKGKPHLEKIIVKVIDSSLTTGELKNGTVDMTPFHPTVLPEVEALNNVEVIRYPGLSYYYVGFKLGTYDGKKVNMNIKKYQNIKLRQAMLYAINREEWVAAFFSGLGKPVNRPLPTAHWIAADNGDMPVQYEFDVEKAKALLDEAGYKDTDADGFREDPNGKEFVVKFSHYATGNPTFEARAKALTQYWEEIGLKTKLQMVDVNLYYDQLEKDDPSLEVFFGGWGTGTDPDPLPLWGDDTVWNYPRWVNEEAQKLLEDAVDISVVGTDTEKRKQLYADWQKIFNEEVPALPILELDEVMAVNERVEGVIFDVSGPNSAHEWWVKQ